MPEVPENIQENLAHLELEANAPRSSIVGHPNSQHSYSGYQAPKSSQNGSQNPADFTPRTSSLPAGAHGVAHGANRASYDFSQGKRPDIPNFSHFPKLVNPPPNVPPTDEEKEAILEDARGPVLNSNDPEMQLAWAQDALSYVDTAVSHEQRMSESQPARSVTPQVEHQLRVDAVNIVSFLAEQHHPKAEFMRGTWLEFGKFGFRQDKKEAFRCYSRATDRGYVRAEYRIGMQYEQSNDPVKALVHYKRGAEAGDSPSNYVRYAFLRSQLPMNANLFVHC
jgi:TPR repeat protein